MIENITDNIVLADQSLAKSLDDMITVLGFYRF